LDGFDGVDSAQPVGCGAQGIQAGRPVPGYPLGFGQLQGSVFCCLGFSCGAIRYAIAPYGLRLTALTPLIPLIHPILVAKKTDGESLAARSITPKSI